MNIIIKERHLSMEMNNFYSDSDHFSRLVADKQSTKYLPYDP